MPMALSYDSIETLRQRVRMGMTRDEVWDVLGEPFSETLTLGERDSEIRYQTSEWQLTIRMAAVGDQVNGVDVRPLDELEREEWQEQYALENPSEAGNGHKTQPQYGSPPTATEYEVYTGVCRTRLFLWELDGTTFDDETISNRDTKLPLPRLERVVPADCLRYPEMLDDFHRKNAQPSKLEKQFKVINGYQLLSERRAADPESKGGVFGLSRVGFNQDETAALVHLSYGGVSYFLLLEKRSYGWELTDKTYGTRYSYR
jgi:hypothetical protein